MGSDTVLPITFSFLPLASPNLLPPALKTVPFLSDPVPWCPPDFDLYSIAPNLIKSPSRFPIGYLRSSPDLPIGLAGIPLKVFKSP